MNKQAATIIYSNFVDALDAFLDYFSHIKFALKADNLGFNSPSGYKVGRPGHFKYMWVGQYEPSCLQFPSSVLEDKL